MGPTRWPRTGYGYGDGSGHDGRRRTGRGPWPYGGSRELSCWAEERTWYHRHPRACLGRLCRSRENQRRANARGASDDVRGDGNRNLAGTPGHDEPDVRNAPRSIYEGSHGGPEIAARTDANATQQSDGASSGAPGTRSRHDGPDGAAAFLALMGRAAAMGNIARSQIR